MKNLFIMTVFALLSTTLFSCTADELETANGTNKRTEIKENPIPATAPQADVPIPGPGDDPVVVFPPKK